MDKEYEQVYLQFEKDYWWFKARRFWLKKLCKDAKEKILEVGAGSGMNVKDLPGDKTILDIATYGKKEAEKNDLRFIKGDAQKTTFKDKSFDTVIALDVLEHLDDDTTALQEWKRIAKKRIILSVPAYQWLWSTHDDINHHKRRYTKKEIEQLVKKIGLKIVYLSYWNCTLFPLTLIRKKITNTEKLKKLHPLINSLFAWIGKKEFTYIHNKHTLPFGSSIVGVFEIQ